MASLNDKDTWRGDINDVIAMSIHDSGMRLSISPTTARKLDPAAG
jgi:hypothetical protein